MRDNFACRCILKYFDYIKANSTQWKSRLRQLYIIKLKEVRQIKSWDKKQSREIFFNLYHFGRVHDMSMFLSYIIALKWLDYDMYISSSVPLYSMIKYRLELIIIFVLT